MTTRLAVATLVLALTGEALARAPKPPLCRDGRFVTPPGRPSLVAGTVAATPDALVLAGGTPTIAIAGLCPAVKVHLRATKKGTIVTAAWPRNACGATRVRLRATIDATCQAMQGVLRVPRSTPLRFVAPRCGDGSVDAADGEQCDGGGCDASQQCNADCRCVPQTPPVSFGDDVQPILAARCAVPSCHSGVVPMQGLDLSPGQSYAAVVGRPSTERSDLKLVDPGAPATSYLEWKVSGAPAGQTILGSPMPLTGGPLSPAEQAIIRTWIAEGALNDQPVATTTTTTVSTTVTTVVTVTTTSTTVGTVPDSTTTTTTTQPPPVSFRGDVQPILTSKCAIPTCHSGAFPTQGLNLDEGSAYAAIVNVTSTERPPVKLVDPGSIETSYLWWKVGQAPAGETILGLPMPLTGGPLSLTEMATIRDWITEGATDN